MGREKLLFAFISMESRYNSIILYVSEQVFLLLFFGVPGKPKGWLG